MKYGDKVLCINSYNNGGIGGIELFLVGNYYNVVMVYEVLSDYKGHFSDRQGNFLPSTWVRVENFDGRVRDFSLIKMDVLNYFGDYFAGIKEIRKSKLMEIFHK